MVSLNRVLQKIKSQSAFFLAIFFLLDIAIVSAAEQGVAASAATTSSIATNPTTAQEAVSSATDVQPPAVTGAASILATSGGNVAPINDKNPALQQPSTSSQLASLVGGLALILILIFGLSWFVKRFSQGGFVQNQTIKMISAMPLGTRERIMLIDVGGKHILLGLTPTQINTLHVFEEPVVTASDKNVSNSDFSKKLMSILQQKNFIQPNNDSFKDSQR